ncbi:hypothetical protein ACQKOF_09075, partial [Lysinibacillus sp. NPDC093190]|uniref:hypothetical protein n=1 Tax=Lysinibacillus sp. NPDC093190 TaxID=3390575 RepID=UPI003D0744F6
KTLLLSLRFRTDKTFVAVASLSHRQNPVAAATLALRFRTENIRCAPGYRANRCFLRESEAAAAPMLVTKALLQDVMLLAFVPLPLIPKESPSLHSNQLNLLFLPLQCEKNHSAYLCKVAHFL